MKLEYALKANDYLAHQLYQAYKSERINKNERNGRLYITIGAAVVALLFYYEQLLVVAIYFALFALVTFIFYPKYFKRRHKKHYERYINENFQSRFGEKAHVTFREGDILVNDKTGESQIRISAVDIVYETKDHIFIRIETAVSLIIPKAQIENLESLKAKLTSMGLTIIEDLNWEWN